MNPDEPQSQEESVIDGINRAFDQVAKRMTSMYERLDKVERKDNVEAHLDRVKQAIFDKIDRNEPYQQNIEEIDTFFGSFDD